MPLLSFSPFFVAPYFHKTSIPAIRKFFGSLKYETSDSTSHQQRSQMNDEFLFFLFSYYNELCCFYRPPPTWRR